MRLKSNVTHEPGVGGVVLVLGDCVIPRRCYPAREWIGKLRSIDILQSPKLGFKRTRIRSPWAHDEVYLKEV